MTEAEALEASIKHWEENRDDPENAEMSSRSCALCDKFIALDCKGCPVFRKTGQPACLDTPYQNCCCTDASLFPAEYKKIAQAEIDFLISLRKHS